MTSPRQARWGSSAGAWGSTRALIAGANDQQQQQRSRGNEGSDNQRCEFKLAMPVETGRWREAQGRDRRGRKVIRRNTRRERRVKSHTDAQGQVWTRQGKARQAGASAGVYARDTHTAAQALRLRTWLSTNNTGYTSVASLIHC